MNEEPKEASTEPGSRLEEIIEGGLMNASAQGMTWRETAAVIGKIVRDGIRHGVGVAIDGVGATDVIIADVANRAGMAALHVDQLHRLLDPLMAKLELPGMEYSSLTFAATEDWETCDSCYRWTASVRLGTGYSHGYGQTPEGAVNALLSKFGDKTTRESLDLAIANQREKLRNMEEQLAKLDGFPAVEAEERIRGHIITQTPSNEAEACGGVR